MKTHFMILGALLLGAGLIPANAQAQEQTCREFTRDVSIDGQQVEAIGTACLQRDGTWRIVGDDHAQNAPETGERVVFVQPRQKVYYSSSYYKPYHKPYYSVGYGRSYGKSYGYGGYHKGAYAKKSYGHKYGHSGYYKKKY